MIFKINKIKFSPKIPFLEYTHIGFQSKRIDEISTVSRQNNFSLFKMSIWNGSNSNDGLCVVVSAGMEMITVTNKSQVAHAHYYETNAQCIRTVFITHNDTIPNRYGVWCMFICALSVDE